MGDSRDNFFEQYRNRLVRYINNILLLGRLQLVSKLSKLMSMFIIWALISILFVLVILFISFMAAYFFSDLFNSNIKGFGLVALIYVILLVVLSLSPKSFIKKFIATQVIAVIFEKTAVDDKNETDDENEEEGPKA